MPLAWRDTFMDPAVSWGFLTEPEPHADGRVLPAPRGKVLGGSASVNGMMYSRGFAADYDEWAGAGLAGWSFADVLPYFRRSESNWRGASAYHGADGPLTVSRHVPDAFIFPGSSRPPGHWDSRSSKGFTASRRRVSRYRFHRDRGERASTAARFLRPALGRPNLTVITDALVHRLLIEGSASVRGRIQRGRQRA